MTVVPTLAPTTAAKAGPISIAPASTRLNNTTLTSVELCTAAVAAVPTTNPVGTEALYSLDRTAPLMTKPIALARVTVDIRNRAMPPINEIAAIIAHLRARQHTVIRPYAAVTGGMLCVRPLAALRPYSAARAQIRPEVVGWICREASPPSPPSGIT